MSVRVESRPTVASKTLVCLSKLRIEEKNDSKLAMVRGGWLPGDGLDKLLDQVFPDSPPPDPPAPDPPLIDDDAPQSIKEALTNLLRNVYVGEQGDVDVANDLMYDNETPYGASTLSRNPVLGSVQSIETFGKQGKIGTGTFMLKCAECRMLDDTDKPLKSPKFVLEFVSQGTYYSNYEFYQELLGQKGGEQIPNPLFLEAKPGKIKFLHLPSQMGPATISSLIENAADVTLNKHSNTMDY